MKASTMSICIVTFRQRGEMVRKLVADIRQRVPEDVDIILAINGNNNEDMPDWYRRSMLELCMMHKKVYPILCPEF